MKPAGMYVLAALLLAASIPIYRYIWTRAVRPERAEVSPSGPARIAPAEIRSPPGRGRIVLTANESRAMDALASGRAKCVGGVVYRTSDHVIEPWPGGVKCLSDGRGAWSGVVATGV